MGNTSDVDDINPYIRYKVSYIADSGEMYKLIAKFIFRQYSKVPLFLQRLMNYLNNTMLIDAKFQPLGK